MNLQMLKKAMLAYVSAVKFVWSEIVYPLSIVGKKLMNLRGYRVYGNSVQDGTPTPDSPVEIESVGDLSTKNLFDTQGWYNWLRTFTTTYVQKQVVDGISCIYYRPLSTFNKEYMKGQFKVNTRYTISFRAKGIIGTDYSTGFRFMYTDGTSTSVSVSNNDTWNEYTLTSISGKTIDNIQMFLNYPQGCYFDENSIQLEEGTTATEYEPYHKYKIPVVARGKNMATAQQVYSNASDYSECIEDGRNCIRCTSGGKSYAGINFKANTQYTVRFEAKTVVRSSYEEDGSPECLFAFTHTDGTRKLIVVYGSKDWKYYEATSLANKTIASVGMYSYNYKHWIYINVDTFQIEEGTTATEYEPYIAPVTTNIYLKEPLRKVGDYADYVDFEKQKVVRKINSYIFSGDENLSNQGNLNLYSMEKLSGMPARNSTNSRCSHYKIIETDYHLVTVNNIFQFGNSYINIGNAGYSSLSDFKDWLKTQSVEVIWVSTLEPTEEPVNLPALPQFKGTTIYEVGTNIKPSGMKAKYC